MPRSDIFAYHHKMPQTQPSLKETTRMTYISRDKKLPVTCTNGRLTSPSQCVCVREELEGEKVSQGHTPIDGKVEFEPLYSSFSHIYMTAEDFQPEAASDTNWESVTSSISGVSYHSPSVTDPTLTADALDKTIAEFDTVEDLLKHFNPESWQDDLENLYLDTPHYRGRSYHDRKSKVDLDRLNDDVKRYSCTPRNHSVNLREELKLTNAVFFPRCLLVQRCGGNCGCGTVSWKSCTCSSGKTVKKYHEVLKFEPGHLKRRGKAKNMALVDIQLDHHERCDCICSSRPPR
ncbi:Pdgfd [Phodopus roborovskii]|uniref:Pdgfd protein n=1 Tax=Phodopus roborovskii TaxID=109678 RepID=A0AAU9Z0M1_PHORO|nr:Pdgfd [Phodopus roborovskii]